MTMPVVYRAIDLFRLLFRAEWRVSYGDRSALDAEQSWGSDGPPVIS